MKKIIIIVCLLSLSAGLFAEKLSIKKGVLLSLLVPGAGHYYAGNNLKGGFFLGADLAFLLTGLAIKKETKVAINSYKKYAYVYAGAAKGQNDEYYKNVGKFYNSDLYNDRQKYYTSNPNIYNDNIAWQWQSRKNLLRYRTKRENKQRLEVYTSFAFSAMIVNRIIAAVDARGVINRFNKQIGGELSFKPDFINKGIKLNYEVKF